MKVKSIKNVNPNLTLVANTRFKVVSADSGRNQCRPQTSGWHNLPNGDCKGFFTSRFKGGCYLMP